MADTWAQLPSAVQSQFLQLGRLRGRSEDLKQICGVSQEFTRLCQDRALDRFWQDGIGLLRGGVVRGRPLQEVSPGSRCWFQAWIREMDLMKLADFFKTLKFPRSSRQQNFRPTNLKPEQLAALEELDLSNATIGDEGLSQIAA